MHKKVEEALKKDNELAQALINVKDSYDFFVIGIFSGYGLYPGLKEKILNFINEHKSATSSDIIIYYTEEFRGIKRRVKYSFEK